MHRLRRYDVFRFAQNDVAPLRFAMMRCLLQNVAKPRIIREANIIRRSRHHLPKANIIQKTHLCLCRQKCVFCWCGKRDSWTYLALLDSAFASKRARTATSGSRVLPAHFRSKKAGRLKAYLLFWCGKRDLNPYGVNHTPLKRARLPVPPLPRVRLARNILYYTRFFQNVKSFFKKNENFYKKFFLKTLDKTFSIVYNIEVVNRRRTVRGYDGKCHLNDLLQVPPRRAASCKNQQQTQYAGMCGKIPPHPIIFIRGYGGIGVLSSRTSDAGRIAYAVIRACFAVATYILHVSPYRN